MIRFGHPEDIEAIARIEHAAQPTGWTQEQLAEELAGDNAIFLVAEEDGAVCGFSIGWRVADETHVLDVAVDLNHRRRGLGRALIESLIREGGPGNVLLELRASNTSALRLYESLGFTIAGHRSGYYQDGEDALLMTLPAAKVVLPGEG